jgi:hypothetical protein
MQADAFVKNFTNHCRECINSNEVKTKTKTITTLSILWQGDSDRIICMKSSMAPKCKFCLVEWKEILHQMQEEKNKIISNNLDIFSSFKCNCRFHNFGGYQYVETWHLGRVFYSSPHHLISQILWDYFNGYLLLRLATEDKSRCNRIVWRIGFLDIEWSLSPISWTQYIVLLHTCSI